MLFKISVIVGIYLAVILFLAGLARLILLNRKSNISFWKLTMLLIVTALAGNIFYYLLFVTFFQPISGYWWVREGDPLPWRIRIVQLLPFLPFVMMILVAAWRINQHWRQPANNRT